MPKRCAPEMNPEGISEMSKVVKTQPFQSAPWSVCLRRSHTVVWRTIPTSLFQSFLAILDNHGLFSNQALWTSNLHLCSLLCLKCHFAQLLRSPNFPPQPRVPPARSSLLLSSVNPLSPNPSRVSSSACSLQKVISCYPDPSLPNTLPSLLGGLLAFSTL